MLRDILPPRTRRFAYATFAAVGLLLGAIPVYCAAVGVDTPPVVAGLLAVYAFLGGPLFGYTAVANTTRGRPLPPNLGNE